MPQIIPIKDLKDTAAISEMCHQADSPIFITKNGYGDMVLMSMEVYESMQKKWEIYSEIEQAEAEIARGQTMSAREGLAAVRAKYGL